MRGFTKSIVVITIIASADATALAGDIQYVAQRRFVTASAGDSSERIESLDFGPFNQTATANSSDGRSMGTASQNSILGNLNISASGTVTGDGEEGFSESFFSVNFDLLDDVLVELSGDLSIFGGDAGFTEVRLREADGADVFRLFFDIEGSGEFSESFVLFASEYQLIGNTFGEFFSGAGDLNGVFNINLDIVPGPPTAMLFAIGGIAALGRRRGCAGR